MTAGAEAGAARAAACRVERLRLYRFRNYEELRLELGPTLNVFAGENAQGKTNLLEALATLLLTRSPRTSSLADLLEWGGDEALVEAVVARPAGETALTLRLRREGSRVIRTTSVDGTGRAARELLGICPVVLFWPDDLQLVKAGPDGRRRRLDMLLSQLDRRAAADLLRYRRVVEQRNALLRRLRLGSGDHRELAAFDAALVDLGARIRVARARLVRALSPLAAAAMAEISDGRELLELDYAVDGGVGDDEETADLAVEESGTGAAEDGDDLAAARERLRARLARLAGEELARAVTLTGPHRDDVVYRIDTRPARTTASQGQQRSAVLATTLAEVRHVQAEAGVAPVLILDDVLSELDPGRRGRLLAALEREGSPQTLVTTTDAELLDVAGMRRYRVSAGSVTRER